MSGRKESPPKDPKDPKESPTYHAPVKLIAEDMVEDEAGRLIYIGDRKKTVFQAKPQLFPKKVKEVEAEDVKLCLRKDGRIKLDIATKYIRYSDTVKAKMNHHIPLVVGDASVQDSAKTKFLQM